LKADFHVGSFVNHPGSREVKCSVCGERVFVRDELMGVPICIRCLEAR
jgi:formylmethanofuran dehydrogenase subunit E